MQCMSFDWKEGRTGSQSFGRIKRKPAMNNDVLVACKNPLESIVEPLNFEYPPFVFPVSTYLIILGMIYIFNGPSSAAGKGDKVR